MAKLRPFSLAFKVKIIKYYESLQAIRPVLNIKERSLGFVSKRAKICRQSLRDWIRDKDIINEQLHKHQRFKRSPQNSSKCICKEMEDRLTEWLHNERSKGACIDSVILRSKAERYYNEIHPLNPPEDFVVTCTKERQPFKCSEGWFQNFLRRNNFALRRISSTGRDLPKDTIKRIGSFYIEVKCYIQNWSKSKFC